MVEAAEEVEEVLELEVNCIEISLIFTKAQ